MPKLLRATTLVLTITTSLALAPLAHAANRPLHGHLVPYQSVGGIGLDMSALTVVSRLGGGLSSTGQQAAWKRGRAGLIVTFSTSRRGQPVSSIEAFGPTNSFRTAQGLGIGSPRGAIRRHFRNLTCNKIECDGHRGSHHMSFSFAHGRVNQIDLFDTRLPRG